MTEPARLHVGARRGFTMVEVLVAGVLFGLAMALMVPVLAQGMRLARVQPEAAELDQRLRVAVQGLTRALEAAGAGPASGEPAGSINQRVPAIFPQRRGVATSDDPEAAHADRLTVVSAVAGLPAVPLLFDMPSATAPLVFAAGSRCPLGDPGCGFRVGAAALVDDRAGNFDLFRVTAITGTALAHTPVALSRAYASVDARVLPVEIRQFRFDAVRRQVRVANGLSAETPWLDEVLAFECRYFGLADPPFVPRPPLGTETCLFHADGRPRLGRLAGAVGGHVELPLAMLRDGPFCGSGAARYDADLLRVRRVVIRLRLGGMSGARPSGAPSPLDHVSREREVVVDVAPRNLDVSS